MKWKQFTVAVQRMTIFEWLCCSISRRHLINRENDDQRVSVLILLHCAHRDQSCYSYFHSVQERFLWFSLDCYLSYHFVRVPHTVGMMPSSFMFIHRLVIISPRRIFNDESSKHRKFQIKHSKHSKRINFMLVCLKNLLSSKLSLTRLSTTSSQRCIAPRLANAF